jgi:hypothetical protein
MILNRAGCRDTPLRPAVEPADLDALIVAGAGAMSTAARRITPAVRQAGEDLGRHAAAQSRSGQAMIAPAIRRCCPSSCRLRWPTAPRVSRPYSPLHYRLTPASRQARGVSRQR